MCLFTFYTSFFNHQLNGKIWWPICLATILLCLYVKRKYQVYQTSEVVILEGSKQPIILFQYGNEGVIFSKLPADSLLKNEDYYLSGYREIKGIDHLEIINKSNSGEFFYVDFDEGIMRFKNSQNSEPPRLNFDGIQLMSRIDSIRGENFLVVIPSNVRPYQCSLLKAHLKKIDQPFWDMSQEGVIEIQINPEDDLVK